MVKQLLRVDQTKVMRKIHRTLYNRRAITVTPLSPSKDPPPRVKASKSNIKIQILIDDEHFMHSLSETDKESLNL